MKLKITLLLAAGLFAPGALASTPPPPAQLQLESVVAQQMQIRADVLAGEGRYKNMPRKTKDELLSRQAALLRLIGDRRDTGEMTKEERIEAFNTLEWIEATLNDVPDERMVCRRERRTGSMQVSTVCKTQRQIKEAQERARRQMEGSMPISI